MNENEMMVEVEENLNEETYEECGTSRVSGGAIAAGLGVLGALAAGAVIAVKKTGGPKAVKSKMAEKKAARLEKKLEKVYSKIEENKNSDEIVEVEAEVVE